jgi:hypothetical protein
MAEEIQAPTEAEQVGILSAPTPDSVQAWRDEDPARGLYSKNSEFGEAVPDNMFDGANLPTEKRQAAVNELRSMLADTGLSPNEARQLLNRSGMVRSAGMSDEQQRKEAQNALSKIYGKDADDVIADTRKLIARDPRLAKYLHVHGIGNDGETVLLMARAARSQRAAGRLK